MSLIVDAHEDLAYNILSFGRDYTRSSEETRLIEKNTTTPDRNGNTMLGWPDYQRGRVAVIFSTLFALPERCKTGDWEVICYSDSSQAHKLYMAQIDCYKKLVDNHSDKFCLIETKQNLMETLLPWQQIDDPDSHPTYPVGLVLLMEGAEGVQTPSELDAWWESGVRIIGPAWAGTRFCGGTNEPGPLTKEGYQLLAAMADLGFTLDISHMDEKSALQALDYYQGPVIASHANPSAIVRTSNTNRHLSDKVIRGIIEREGVIGTVVYNPFLRTDWKPGCTQPPVTLHDVALHIDYICQMAGNSNCAGIGSDFDGGTPHTPSDIDSISDLQNLSPILTEMGYSPNDIDLILGKNWINYLENNLP
jgi:membrane dipeptidase